MGFWTEPGTSPKRQFRWALYMDNNPAWTLKSASQPSFEVTSVDHNFLSHRFSFPGRVQWNTVSITLVDPIDPDTSAEVLSWIRDSGYAPPVDKADFRSITKEKAVARLQGLEIQMLDGEGEPVAKWSLRNPFILNASFGDLDYTSDELTEITLEIRFDFAKYEAVAGAASDGTKIPW